MLCLLLLLQLCLSLLQLLSSISVQLLVTELLLLGRVGLRHWRVLRLWLLLPLLHLSHLRLRREVLLLMHPQALRR